MDTSTTRFIRLMDALASVNNSGRWKIWPRHNFNQLSNGDIGLLNHSQTGINYFGEVMWRNIRRHTNSNT